MVDAESKKALGLGQEPKGRKETDTEREKRQKKIRSYQRNNR